MTYPHHPLAVMRHLTRMLRPVITELNVEWGASAAYAFPAQMRPLFVGDPMNLYALFDKLPVRIGWTSCVPFRHSIYAFVIIY